MTEYRSEIHRTLERIEVLEKVALDLEVTGEEIRRQYDVSGEIRGTVVPDDEVVRARTHPPTSVPGRIVGAVGGGGAVTGKGYPGTSQFVGLARIPPMIQGGEWADDPEDQAFSVEGIPHNGTVEMTCEWDADDAESARVAGDPEAISVEYDVVDYPEDRLPVRIGTELHRDAREYVETMLEESGEIWDEEELRTVSARFEGLAAFSVELEHRADVPGVKALDEKVLDVERFRLGLDPPIDDLELVAGGQNQVNHTYDPDAGRAEWYDRRLAPGQVIRYAVAAPVDRILDLASISAEFHGRFDGDTLTGTRIVDVYDRTGQSIRTQDRLDVDQVHGVAVAGSIAVDPATFGGEGKAIESGEPVTVDHREVTTATVTVEAGPDEAFGRVEEACRGGSTAIEECSPPPDADPGSGDAPGTLEIEREYDGDVVSVEVTVSGAERGKTSVEIRARSSDADHNAAVIDEVEDWLTRRDAREQGGERG